MKRYLLFLLVLMAIASSSYAAHIIGGEMRYTYVGPGVGPNSKIYKVTLILFKGDDPNGAALAGSYVVGVFNNDNGSKVIGTAANNNWQVTKDVPPDIQPVQILLPSCIQNPPTLNYTYASYSMNIELPVNNNGYTIAYQTCCRINGLMNVGNGTGSSYVCIIPGTNLLPSGNDSSPQFKTSLNVICKNSPFTLDFSATDPDGDSLSYYFCYAYGGGAATNAGFNDPAPPPYASVFYTPPYTSSDPFGTGATINPQTGIISGMAPDLGKYVVSVCINVFRNGVLMGSHRKDLIVQVSDCSLTQANPMPDFTTCNGSDIQFSHTSTGANTVFWDFGVASLLNDTSNLNNPTYHYVDTGTYLVKFVINRGTSCADSVIRRIGVYPGFVPGFTVGGGCFQNPFQFTDTTHPSYGVVNSWSWNFGDLTTLADTSHIGNPRWTFAGPGPKTAQMIVTSTKGCIDTVTVDFNVLDKPALTLPFKDTLICVPDAVTLSAAGTGTFSWTPPVRIINANTATPTVNPLTDTWYYVTLNDNGCVNNDSVHVRVVSGVQLQAMADTTICLTDAVQLHAVSNGLSFQWSPAATLDDPTLANPKATPTAASTTYHVRASIGTCFAGDDVVVNTVPYPLANAGPNPTICYNTSIQLNGSHDGTSFSWTPTSYLSNPTILNPIASPPRTTSYVLTVYDTKGCPKPGRDTVTVFVQPKVHAFAGNDTAVVVGQPLQFNGTGGVTYLWSPGTGLNNVNIYNPVGVYGQNNDTIKYKLVVRDAIGCADSANITVTVFQTKSSIFVPTAFTPNGDGLNEEVMPIAVGMKRINYFSIYNRWGQLVFTTTSNKKGWDGKFNGRVQDPDVFVWMVSAVDYLDKAVFLKGTVTLIR